MSVQNQSRHVAPEPAPLGCIGLIVRILWLMAGNIALFALAVLIFQRRAFSSFDILFWAIVAGLIVIRRIDITRLNGLTSNSEPTTLRHWRAYAIRLSAASVILWGLAHAVPLLTSR